MINQQPADLRLNVVSTIAERDAFNTGELEAGVLMFVSDVASLFTLLEDGTWAPATQSGALETAYVGVIDITVPVGANTLGTVTIPAGVGVNWLVDFSLSFQTAAGITAYNVTTGGTFGQVQSESGLAASVNRTVTGKFVVPGAVGAQTINLIAAFTGAGDSAVRNSYLSYSAIQ